MYRGRTGVVRMRSRSQARLTPQLTNDKPDVKKLRVFITPITTGRTGPRLRAGSQAAVPQTHRLHSRTQSSSRDPGQRSRRPRLPLPAQSRRLSDAATAAHGASQKRARFGGTDGRGAATGEPHAGGGAALAAVDGPVPQCSETAARCLGAATPAAAQGSVGRQPRTMPGLPSPPRKNERQRSTARSAADSGTSEIRAAASGSRSPGSHDPGGPADAAGRSRGQRRPPAPAQAHLSTAPAAARSHEVTSHASPVVRPGTGA